MNINDFFQNGNSVFGVFGQPGTGKTVLLDNILAHSPERKIKIYDDYQMLDRKRASIMRSRIVYEIASTRHTDLKVFIVFHRFDSLPFFLSIKRGFVAWVFTSFGVEEYHLLKKYIYVKELKKFRRLFTDSIRTNKPSRPYLVAMRGQKRKAKTIIGSFQILKESEGVYP